MMEGRGWRGEGSVLQCNWPVVSARSLGSRVEDEAEVPGEAAVPHLPALLCIH